MTVNWSGTVARVVAVVSLFSLGAATGWLANDLIFSPHGGREFHLPGQYSFISPLLRCEIPPDGRNAEAMERMQRRFEETIGLHTGTGRVRRVSVYFRDLTQGYTCGVNEMDAFEPASLVKVPLMMVYFKTAETHPQLLQERITLPRDFQDLDARRAFASAEQARPGKTYTVEELIRLMIVDSDNNAQVVLEGYIGSGYFGRMVTELGVPVKLFEGQGNMPLKAYASFFQVLYNATYLSRYFSERALSLLRDVTFSEGIEAGLPPGTKFANKFGERTYGPTEPRQLHDCGIVYHPRRPYLLCVMSQGADFEPMKETLRDISRVAYEEVEGDFLALGPDDRR